MNENLSLPEWPHHLTGRLTKLSFLAALSAINFWLLMHGQMRTPAFMCVLAPLLCVTLLNVNLGICLTLAYLIVMGDIRRIANLELGAPQFDLLLLVGPLVAAFLGIPKLLNLRLKDGLSKAATALAVIMTIEIFNPKQGGIAVGAAGAMFYLIPILWFWVARQSGTPQLIERLLFTFVLPLGLVAAALGILQTFVGFLPWEQAWIDSGAMSVKVGDAFRAFGFSVSPAEYGRLLVFTAAILFARFIFGDKRCGFLLVLPLTGIVLESTRGTVLRVAGGFAVMWALRQVRSNGFVLRFAAALAVMLLAIYGAASRVSPNSSDTPTKGTQALIAHQAGGLSNPLDERKSTVGAHFFYFGKGLASGLKNPLGFGLGSTTAATSKIGGSDGDSTGFQTELDITDMFEALVPVGGLVFVSFCAFALASAFKYIQSCPSRAAGIAVIGMLAANFGNWLISGEYSSSAIMLFLIGATAWRPSDEASALRAPGGYLALASNT